MLISYLFGHVHFSSSLDMVLSEGTLTAEEAISDLSDLTSGHVGFTRESLFEKSQPKAHIESPHCVHSRLNLKQAINEALTGMVYHYKR